MAVEDEVKEIRDRNRDWFSYFKYWSTTYYVCGTLAAFSSTLAASQVAGDWKPTFALVSSLLIAFIAFANPQRRANSYIGAWRVLGTALLRYGGGELEFAGLVAEVKRGEDIIADGSAPDTDPPGPHRSRTTDPDKPIK
jgi:hypothetical protein